MIEMFFEALDEGVSYDLTPYQRKPGDALDPELEHHAQPVVVDDTYGSEDEDGDDVGVV